MLLKAPPQTAVDIELLRQRSLFVISPRFCIISKPIQIGAYDIHPIRALTKMPLIEVHHGRWDRLAALFGGEGDDFPNAAGLAKGVI
jgi:hypothetical protein